MRALLAGAVAVGTAAIAGCTAGAARRAGTSAATAAPLPVLRRDDVAWLERTTFGLDSRTLTEYERLGRSRYLERQLHPDGDALPPSIAEQIEALDISHLDVRRTLAELRMRRMAIRAMPDGQDKLRARRDLNEEGNRLADEAIRRELLRAIYSPDQIRELMVWFWLNHFSVHEYKGDARWLVADYAEQAIRPHALGHFRDLVLATLEHPAMLEYLDNRQNAAGHLNENYARELMELHTLGVGSGYTQQDVQQLARVLTGIGINPGPAPRLRPALRRLYVRHGAFEFNPARHDFGPKVLLGHHLRKQGFAEVEEAVSWIVRQPACAQFISRELATYFVSDDPPAHLVNAMAIRFEQTDGDIAAVLERMFTSTELDASLGTKFKDPMRYVVSAVRLAYDGRTITNTRPLVNWLRALGEAPYGHQTPDGYPLTAAGWDSPGQMSRRFEVARAIGSGNAHLFEPEGGSERAGGPARGAAAAGGMMATAASQRQPLGAFSAGAAAPARFPQLASRVYYEAIQPFLAEHTRMALDEADSQLEWNTFLLASPELNYD